MTLSVNKVSFETTYSNNKDKTTNTTLSKGKRACIAASALTGVGASLVVLSQLVKGKKYSLNPKKILKTNLKDTYLFQAKFEEPEVIAMGAGSILGGLVGGVIVDERSSNTSAEIRSKAGEGIIQFANITVPIVFVGQGSRWGDKLEKHIEKNFTAKTSKIKRAVSKLPKIVCMATGLGVGMYLGNVLANFLKEKLLDAPEDRKMKFSDLFMHWDDLCLAASFYAGNPETIMVDGVATQAPLTVAQKVTTACSRILPLVMMSAGYQVGCKGVEKTSKQQQEMIA